MSTMTGQGAALPRAVLAEGTLQALKWLALVLMSIDHVNKYLFDWAHPWMFLVGRLAMPLFTLVLAYNLARPEAVSSGAAGRCARRLVAIGTVATVPFIALGHVQGGWWPLNILFTLALGAAVMHLWARGATSLAIGAFVVGGALVEFAWLAVALLIAATSYFKRPSLRAALVVVASLGLVGALNGNQWAFAALAVFGLATQVKLDVPRLQRVFYAFYPVHLTCLWLAHSLVLQ